MRRPLPQHTNHTVLLGLPPINIWACLLLSLPPSSFPHHHYSRTSSLLQDLHPSEALISSSFPSDTQPLTLDPTSIMSRHPPDLPANYRYRTLPEPHWSNNGFPTDPARYISRNTENNGWREKREPFEELLPMRGEDRPQHLDSPTLAPIHNFRIAQGSRKPGTPPGYNDSERSIQTTPHVRRPEERSSERPAPRAHECPKSRRSEGEVLEIQRNLKSTITSQCPTKTT